jgi:hypothetical protein
MRALAQTLCYNKIIQEIVHEKKSDANKTF